MSLGIAFKGAEGIVLAADSRVTLTTVIQQTTPQQVLTSHYDNATKLLRVNGQEYVGAVTYGAGAIGQRSPRTAHSYLPEFEAELAQSGGGRLTVEDFASQLSDFFMRQWQAAQMPSQDPPMTFLVGGYDSDAAYGRVFEFHVPTAPKPREQHPGSDQFGMVWGGQREFTDRLITGFDGQLPSIVQGILGLCDTETDNVATQLKEHLQVRIPFPFLPLQDSVDLSILLIRTTIAVQNWVVGVRGVGGPIDVAAITRTGGFTPIQQKSITGERIEWRAPLKQMEERPS